MKLIFEVEIRIRSLSILESFLSQAFEETDSNGMSIECDGLPFSLQKFSPVRLVGPNCLQFVSRARDPYHLF